MIKVKFDFEKKSSTKGLVIEGFANANVFDRCQERIEPKGWELGNYKKNPVILFDHGHDMAFGSMPVGKAVGVEPQDGGLYMKALISNSKTEKISAVRDLVEEGILKTFSVGFNPMADAEKSGNGIVIPKAELIECSIVPVPMNQDSTFSVSSRSFKSAIASEWFNGYLKAHELYKKGARHAAIITNAMRKQGLNFVSLMELVKGCGLNEDQVMSVLDGAVLDLDKDTIQAFSKALNIEVSSFDIIEVKELREDLEGNEEKPSEDGEDQEQQDDTEDQEEEDKSEEKPDPEMMKMSEDEMAAYKRDCEATSNDGEGNPASWVADEEAWNKAKEAASQSYSRDDSERFWAVTTWLYLNRFGGTVKQGEEKPDGSDKSTVSQNEKNTMATGDNAVAPDQNPYLETAKQTNVLLGTLVMEMQKVNGKLEKMVEPEQKPEPVMAPVQEPKPEENQEDEAKKMIAKIQKTHDDLRKRIERL